jgi:hypothetical protein
MAENVVENRTVMQPRQAQKRQLRSAKKLHSIAVAPAPAPAPAAAPESARKQARVRQQRADRATKQPAPSLAALSAAAPVVPPRKVVIARTGQVHQRGVMRAIVSRVPAGAVIVARPPDKIAIARSSQKAQVKTVRMSALKATTVAR